MLTEQLTVRFYETDALGHVNNTVMPQWFETGRIPLFELFNTQENIGLIVANLNVDFIHPVYFGHPVTLNTFISRTGNSSFEIGTEIWQLDKLCAKGATVMVNYDYANSRSVPLADDIKAKLCEYAHPAHPIA